MDLRQNLSLRPALTQAMQRSLQILELPLLELSRLVEEEIEKNPLLELETRKMTPIPEFIPEIVAPISLQDHLIAQIKIAFSKEEQILAEEALSKLDERGFLAEPVPEQILKVLQTFDPPGIFARDLREAFLLQLEKDSTAYEIVQDHFDDLLKGRLKKLEKRFGPLNNILKKLSRLSTRPASAFDKSSAQPIFVDLRVRKVDRKWVVEAIEDALPSIRFNSEYLNLPSEQKATVRSFKASAKWLIRSIERRRKLLLEMATYLVQKQSNFLNQAGPLVPISPKELASLFAIHESTVSRALADKYVETPLGILPLKSFVSANGAKELLEKLLLQETTPRTDEELVLELQKAGYKLARRTVAKYRKKLGILSSLRRQKNGLTVMVFRKR